VWTALVWTALETQPRFATRHAYYPLHAMHTTHYTPLYCRVTPRSRHFTVLLLLLTIFVCLCSMLATSSVASPSLSWRLTIRSSDQVRASLACRCAHTNYAHTKYAHTKHCVSLCSYQALCFFHMHSRLPTYRCLLLLSFAVHPLASSPTAAPSSLIPGALSVVSLVPRFAKQDPRSVFPLARKRGYRYDARLNFGMFFVTRSKVWL
jgi:hypothetical protein